MGEQRPGPSLYLRASAFWAWFAATTIVLGLVTGLVGWLLPARRAYAFGILWARLNLHALRILCGLRWRVHGAAHLQWQQRTPLLGCRVFF